MLFSGYFLESVSEKTGRGSAGPSDAGRAEDKEPGDWKQAVPIARIYCVIDNHVLRILPERG